MNAEIVTIGTELLLGQIVDTNAAYLAEQLNKIGVSVLYKTTVGDNPQRIREALRRALERADVIITSGGLGPTEDDITREAVADVTGRKLVLHQKFIDHIQRMLTERKILFTENNARQAYLPDGALPIENPQGTAPGYIIESGKHILLSLPGVPRELKYLMEQTVLPYLKHKIGHAQVIKYRLLKICGMGESNIDYTIRDLQTSVNPTIGLMAHHGEVDIRITAKAGTVEEADQLIYQLERRIRERLPFSIFGTDADTQEAVLTRLLREHGLTLAIAETNTGGTLGQRLMSVSDEEMVLRGGVVITDSVSLHYLFPGMDRIVEMYGMVNPETAKYLALEVKKIWGARVGLGIAGHRQSQSGKLVDPAVPSYIALHNADGTVITQEYWAAGPPDVIQTRVANMALELLRRVILKIEHRFSD